MEKVKDNKNKNSKELLVVKITPPLINRGDLWFKENENNIKKSLKNPLSPWQGQAVLVSIGITTNLSQLLRTLDELGYKRVAFVKEKGEYSLRGGVLDIFPINRSTPSRLEFFGNYIETIENIGLSEIEKEEKARKRLLKNARHDLDNLKPGQWVVHIDHGIGRFHDKKVNPVYPEESQYIIEYAAGDKLVVPQRSKDRLSRYLGFREPTLNRLGSALWLKTKKKAKEDAEKTAKELLELYSKRIVTRTYPLPPDDETQKEFEISFEHSLTPDQIQALEEIKNDLSQSRPMDRILAGDVGFGKTEVALETAFKIMQNGGQVALLSPTTILAYQHSETAKNRFQKFPVKTALLSRLQKREEAEETLNKTAEGKIDLIVGTHRLLSKDIRFKNLKLLIIDEEQRFGVKQKEKLKKLRPSVHVLSLSATPIPRTLYFALSGLKSISSIQTPPPDKKPVKTHIKKWDVKIIKEAIETEVKKNGQVYFLHNRIDTIEATREWLRKVLPHVSFTLIHGRLPEARLLKNISEFRAGKKQVLVATTIIENGLDLPNVNTLIVSDASRLGLSQAHQLRGRVGRRGEKANAYFLYREGDIKKLQAKEKRPKLLGRLEALEEFQGLGEGYDLALRDLEIRGAGNILGKEQSGAINTVGFNLYCQMLAEAIEKNNQPVL